MAASSRVDSLGADRQAIATSDSTGPGGTAPLLTRPLIAIIFLYQKVISPQQGEVCVFQPTCSHFAQQALRTYGLVQGGLMTSDRLQRCHSCAGGRYRLSERNRALDPIEDHVLWGKTQSDKARPALMDPASPAELSAPAGEKKTAAPNRPHLPHRSPLLAAGLSSVIPGMGKVYAGRPADGLYSLLVTGSSALVAASYGRDEHWGRAGLFGAVGLFFYLGNIYGSAVEARGYDWAREENLPEDEDTLSFEPHYRTGLSHLRAERWQQAREALYHAAKTAPSASLNRRARLRLGQSYLDEGYPERGEGVLRDLLGQIRDRQLESLSAETQYWLGVSTLQQGQWVEASGWFRNVSRRFPELDLSSGARQLETAARQGYGLPHRSPALAMTLSLFLPGSGQAYAGRPWNGLVSLIFNAAAGYLTFDAFRADRHLDGTLLAMLVWSRFYFGGVDNAARYAREFNRRRVAEHLSKYEELMEPDYSD